MKKNKTKSAYWYKENLKKYRIGFIVYNFITIFIIFLIFSAILTIFVEERFYNNVQVTIKNVNNEINIRAKDAPLGGLTLDDPRISVVYYCSDFTINNDDEPSFKQLNDYKVFGVLEREYVTTAQDIRNSELDTFKVELINDHYYMTYVSQKLYKAFDVQDNKEKIVQFVKIYMNIDGELDAHEEFKSSLIIGALVIVILGYISSFFIMKNSTRPLQEFVDKQLAFVSDASHELRTPLAIVQSKIENILANPDQSVYDVSEDLAVSLKELSRLNKLTTELLALARNDQNRQVYNFEKVNLNIVLSEVLDPFIEIAEFENRKLSYTAEDVDVTIDKDKIRELMIILLDNAMKYTSSGDSINVSLKLISGEAVIEVSDTGIGISDVTKEKIFERFYREDKTRSRETGGNGLGLSIAKNIVEDMKGKISVDHNSPKGTKFTIVFPRAK